MSKKTTRLSVAALLMALTFVMQQSIVTSVQAATDITGITGSNGVFNIDPSGANAGIGFREYQNFTLDKGDIANLIFKYGTSDISKFVNLVDNQININGLVNTIRDGNFYNGEAIFVSPNGMVVGESGVLNVGSLSVLTPTAQGMKMYKNGQATLEELGYHGNANVTINGKVLSRGSVGVVAQDLNIGSKASVLAGLNDNAALFDGNNTEALFNSLVKTGKSTNKAGIEFRTYNRNANGADGMNIQGDVVNYGQGNVILTNRGVGFTTNGGKIAAYGGDVHLVNGKGAMNLNGKVQSDNGSVYVASGTKSGAVTLGDNSTLTAKDLVEIVHSGSGDTTVGGTINSSKNAFITEKKGQLNINGKINNKDGKIAIAGNGTGLTFGENSVITNTGETRIANTGANGLIFNGKIVGSANVVSDGSGGFLMLPGSGNIAMTSRAGDFIYNGSVSSTTGKINLTNTGNKMVLSEGSSVTGGQEVLIQNTGKGGMDVKGTIDTTGNTYVQNINGDMNIDGTITNHNIMGVDGKIARKADVLYIYNSGKDMNIAGNIGGESNHLYVKNVGKGDMTVSGTVANKGTSFLYNGATGDMKISGNVTNSGGRLSVTNKGERLIVADGAKITNDTNRIYITNHGAGGMQVDGTVQGDGHILLTNRDGGMDITSNVTSNKGNIVLTNSGSKSMSVSGTAKGKKITVTGKGSDVILGNIDTDQVALDASKKVVINVDNANLLNAGSEADLIKSDGRLFINVNNGTIGEDVVADNAVGKEARDMTKSINVNVAGGIKAFTNDTKKSGDNLVINLATKGKDMNVDRIKADGKVILLTEKDDAGNTGSILNAGTDLGNYANVKGKSIQMISSGSIGTADKALHFRQTDPTQESNVLAVKDINLHARGEEVGEDVNFGTIKSKTGDVTVDLIKDGVVNNAIGKNVNITSRKKDAKLDIKNKSNDTELIKDYFDAEVEDELPDVSDVDL